MIHNVNLQLKSFKIALVPNLYASGGADEEDGTELNMDIFGELDAEWVFLMPPPSASLAISLASVDNTLSVVSRFSL